MAERDKREAAGNKPSRKPHKHEHSHPGGTGAVLGTHLARFSGVQGLSLLVTNLLHYASIPVVARFLGAESLGPTRCSSSSARWSPRSSTWPRSRGRSCAPSGSPTTTTTSRTTTRPTRGSRPVRPTPSASGSSGAPSLRRWRSGWRSPSEPRLRSSSSTTPTRPTRSVRDHHGGGLGDLQARRDRLLVRAPAARLRADRRLPPDLQPDRDRRHPCHRRRGRGGGDRAGDRHHPRDGALHRAVARQLPARLQLR